MMTAAEVAWLESTLLKEFFWNELALAAARSELLVFAKCPDALLGLLAEYNDSSVTVPEAVLRHARRRGQLWSCFNWPRA